MPRQNLTHPPPLKPTPGKDVANLRIIIQYLNSEQAQRRAGQTVPRPRDEAMSAMLAAVQSPILEQMASHGLEQRWALYDSHRVQDLGGIPMDCRGDLVYFRGDVIQVLERTDAEWGLGVCRGRLGVFLFAHTTLGPFIQALKSVVARDDSELSFAKGAVMPAEFNRADSARCTVHQNAEYGLADRDALTVFGPPSDQDRQAHPDRYYTYTPLEEGEIRLVYLTPDDVEAFLACDKQSLFITLDHVALDKAPAYETFSYCWGDANDKRPIFCNGKLLYIPSSLWRAIRWNYPQGGNNTYSILKDGDTCNKQTGPRPAILWADAICINQVDVLEKNHQIPLMRSIYGKAEEVLVYINETKNGFMTMTCLEMIRQATENLPQWTVLPHNVNQEKLGRVDWSAIEELFTQAVFRRSWVIQEIVLGRKVTCCYGMARLTLENIMAAITALHSNNVRPSNSALGHVVQSEKAKEALDGGVRQLFNLSLVKTRWMEGSPYGFIEVLRRFRGAAATDQRDKVYALLSLAPERYQVGLSPDYSANNTVADVYKRVARLAADSGELALLLWNAGGPHPTPGLPSWAPDWSQQSVMGMDFGFYKCAGTPGWRPKVEQPADPAKLTVRGAIFDKITKTCPRWTRGAAQYFPDLDIDWAGSVDAALLIVHHITRAANDLESQNGRYPNGDDFQTAIWQTLSCGFGWGARRRATPADGVHFEAFLSRYRDALHEIESNGGRSLPSDEEATRQALEGLGVQDIQRFKPRPENAEDRARSQLEEKLFPFFNMVMHFQAGHRTCATRHGYLGTVPAEAEEADVIAMFFGIGVPFVLRPTGRGEFKLIGHCYVHGVMDGELVEVGDSNPGDIKVRDAENIDITLV